MMGAGAALRAAAVPLLQTVEGLSGVYPGAPLQAVFPYAVVDCGAESDWGHKSGEGREVRLTVTLRDGGEGAARIQALADAAQAALDLLQEVEGWSLVSFAWLRGRLVRQERGAQGSWAALIEYRARLLKTG